MPDAIQELRERRAKLVHEARDFWSQVEERCKKEDRAPTEDENKRFEAIQSDVGKLKDQIDQAMAANERRSWLDAEEADLEKSAGRRSAPPNSGRTEARTMEWTCGRNKRSIQLAGETATDEYRSEFNRFLRTGEARALKAGDDEAGGFLQAPITMVGELIQAVDNDVWMRQISRILPAVTSTNGIGAPSLDADPADPTWVSELSIGSEDTTMDFGKRELHPHPLAQFIKVSNKLLRAASMSPEAIVRERLAYKAGVVMENAYLNGDGAKKPLGVFTPSNDGISTAYDVSTGNTTTSVTFDGLKEAYYALKAPYRRNASWIFNRAGVTKIAKLKDGNGQYIWQPSVAADKPDTILTRPVYESEYAPNTWTTGLYVGIVGDFSYYWIVDALSLQIQVLRELYAATNQTGYIARMESDGMPVLGEAFRRVKLA